MLHVKVAVMTVIPVKILKIWPEEIAVIILKLEQYRFTTE